MRIRAFIGLFILITFSPVMAFCCDLCSIYNSVDSAQPVANSFRFGVAEQFSYFGKIQDNGRYIENVAHQHMESSITQLFGAYDLTSAVSFQLSLPYINRKFKRIENGEIERGTEAGIGDLSLLAKYTPYQYRENEMIFFVQLFGGIKLPTGDSDRIGEELSEDHHGDEETAHDMEEEEHGTHMHLGRHGGSHEEPGEISSAIHGHDLALGTGSYDFPVGFNIFAEYGRFFADGSLQYIFRTRGDFDYEYADDLLWETGPGFYVSLGHDHSIALKANLSGEYKRKDNVQGETQDDTGIRSVFLGPAVVFTAGDWSGELSWDIPMDINNTGVQSVPEYKLRAAVSYRF